MWSCPAGSGHSIFYDGLLSLCQCSLAYTDRPLKWGDVRFCGPFRCENSFTFHLIEATRKDAKHRHAWCYALVAQSHVVGHGTFTAKVLSIMLNSLVSKFSTKFEHGELDELDIAGHGVLPVRCRYVVVLLVRQLSLLEHFPCQAVQIQLPWYDPSNSFVDP